LTAKVILNPYAGRWMALKRRDEVESALKNCGIDYELVITAGPGDGIQLASRAVTDGFDPVVAAGGDGSISEVVNGMMQEMSKVVDKPVSLGVIPLGTANDFADNLKLPKDILASVKVISARKSRIIDLGIVEAGRQGSKRFFDNNAAIGLEPYVTLVQEGISRIRGTLRYLLATLMAVRDNPQWSMQIEWDRGSYEGPVTLVTVGNLPRTGGIFFMTPHASAFDGLLTFAYGFMRTRRQIIGILPRTMKPGKGSYIEHPSIQEIHTKWLRVHSDQPTPAHADGVVISKNIQDIEYRVVPRVLPVLLP